MFDIIDMKNVIVSFVVAFTLSIPLYTSATVIAGPIANPANGHDYYLLSPNSWTASEAEAEGLGGTLAVISNAAEQEWIFSTFGAYGGTNRNLWIGLRRPWQGGPLVWVTDEKCEYSNWASGQPNNSGNVENCIHTYRAGDVQAGKWNDLADNWQNDPLYGVVEVPGKSNPKSFSEKEKALIGTWYFGGDRNHPCWIVGTENVLFEVFDRRASRLIYTAEGSLLAIDPLHGIYGEMLKDRILWSNGTWWSRKPVEHGNEASSGK